MFKNLEIPKELWPSDPRFGVGPSLIPKKVIEDLANTNSEYLGTSHRKPAVVKVVQELQEGLRTYFNLPDDYEIILGNGGATFLFDMMGLGLVEKKSAHFTLGEFSHKHYLSHKKIPWIEATEFATPYGEGSDPKFVEGFDFVSGVLNETSTGVAIKGLPDYTKTDTIFALDATSGGGQVPCDIKLVDFYYFSPQKVFASEGGLYVAFMSRKARERALKIAKDTRRYIPEVMSFENAITNSIKHQTYNTPSLSSLFYLNEQVKRLNQFGGEKKVVEAANKKAKIIYDWAENHKHLTPYVKDKSYRSNAVATIDADDSFKVEELTDRLRELGIVYDIDSYRKLGRNQFRIGMFHNIGSEDLSKLTQLIDFALKNI